MFVRLFLHQRENCVDLSGCKLDILTSWHARAEPSVSMVTRSSLFLWVSSNVSVKLFLAVLTTIQTQTHARTHARTRRFFFHPTCPCCFFYLVFSPLPLHSSLHYCSSSLKKNPGALSTQLHVFFLFFYMSTATYLWFTYSVYSTLYKPCTGSTARPQMQHFYWSPNMLTLIALCEVVLTLHLCFTS